MSPHCRAVILVQRIGPYHHARFDAWAASRPGEVSVIEFRPGDAVYAWSAVETTGAYRRFACVTRDELRARLDQIQPQVVVCVGYADPEVHDAVAWAVARRIPLVTCSDSTYADEPRLWLKERFKQLVVGAFDAALVAGGRSREYLEQMGFAGDRLFQPWDVVDNDHFAAKAAAARTDAAALREKQRLPRRYFLCVARFVPKKNLEALVRAFARYAGRAGVGAWSLVLSGSGPLEARLRSLAEASGHASRFYFPGFLQYAELPAYYGLAGAFVLPSVSDQWGLVVNEAMAAGLPVIVSSKCGCAPDLVRPGGNGFIFDPEDNEALALRLEEMAGADDERRAAMGRRSSELIAAYSPQAFSGGMEAAVACALKRRRRPVTGPTVWLMNRLATRPAPVS